MEETWKAVVGYEGLYDVSDLGRVKSLLPSKQFPTAGHILKQRRAGQGYTCVMLYKDGVGKNQYTHHLVMRSFVGPCPDGFNINHNDGNKKNNVRTNLEYVTFSENSEHAYRIGLRAPIDPTGERNGNASLTEAQAITIATRLHQGERPCDVAKDLGVSPGPVYDISSRRKWKHLFVQGGKLAHLTDSAK
jgi:hypothetical protein